MNDCISTARLDLIRMTPDFLRSTVAGRRADAEDQIGLNVPETWFACADFAALRLGNLKANPRFEPWLPRALGVRATGEMAGYIGFHTPPDPDYLRPLCPGAVEFGYTVFPEFRRRGYASEAALGLMAWARREHHVPAFVVSVSPTNAPSLALIAKLGFRRIGSHLDEVDGPEDIFALVGEPPTA